ncbi:hypothetical protein ACJX0J_006139, partial [Zea mays]
MFVDQFMCYMMANIISFLTMNLSLKASFVEFSRLEILRFIFSLLVFLFRLYYDFQTTVISMIFKPFLTGKNIYVSGTVPMAIFIR